jgi:hypothetical protein
MWPASPTAKGRRIPLGEQLLEGRAVTAASDAASEDLRVELDGSDGAASELLLERTIEALKAWGKEWARRPTHVLSVGGNTQRLLGVGEKIAEVGRLTHTQVSFATQPKPSGNDEASWVRVEELRKWANPLREVKAPTGGVMLLVVDEVTDGWDVAALAEACGQAGWEATLVLALTRRP